MEQLNDQLELYVVRSKDGKYLRAKGYSGSGESWVPNINNAKIYPKIGTARSQVTFWAQAYPQYGVPEILVLSISATKTLDETDRVLKAIKKKEKREIEYQIRRLEYNLKSMATEKRYQEQELNKIKNKITELENKKKAL